uniref:Uncharacterized protein n=1 Tax=Ciona savignyi TaxID=51511 RepID=H2YPX3_CIOSA
MVLFDTSSTVHVFRPSEKLPMFSKKLGVKVVGATFVPGSPELIGWSQKSQLYMISNKMTVHKLCPKDKADIVPTRVLPVATATLKTPIASLLARKKEAVDDITMHSVSLRNRTLQEAVDGILNTPSHVLPPIHSFHRQFIAALLLDGEPMQQNPGAGVTEMEVVEEASSKVSTKPVVTGSNQLIPVDDFTWLAESFAKLN